MNHENEINVLPPKVPQVLEIRNSNLNTKSVFRLENDDILILTDQT